MTNDSRKKNTARNLFFSVTAYLLTAILTFVSRTIFLKFLSVEYLGLNSLFSNILTVLSLAELGFGVALVFSMYKPFAENDKEKVSQLLQLYKKYYKIIAFIVLALGLIILPFIKPLIGDVPQININIYVVYVIFLLNNVISYFLAYRRSLLLVSQRSDIESKINMIKNIALYGLQIVVLILTKNYYLYLLINTLIIIFDNILIYFITGKIFAPYIVKPKTQLSRSEIKSINKNVYALVYHKVGTVVIFGIDSILITYFISLSVLGVYSNYLLMITFISTVLALISGSFKGSVGNYISLKQPVETKALFNNVTMFWFWIIGLCSISFINLFQPFIALWLGANYLFPDAIMLLIVLSFFTSHSRYIAGMFKECAGLFYQDRFKPILEAAIKLIISIVLIQHVGLAGIFLGTIISSILVPLWIEPYVLYKYYFKESVWKYYLKYLVNFAIIVGVGAVTWFVCSLLPSSGVWIFVAKLGICAILPNLLFFLIYFKTPEFKSLVIMVKGMINSFKVKRAAKKAGETLS